MIGVYSELLIITSDKISYVALVCLKENKHNRMAFTFHHCPEKVDQNLFEHNKQNDKNIHDMNK